jgi:DNA-binding MarR family transcriptional regulator
LKRATRPKVGRGKLLRDLLNEIVYTYFPLRAFGDRITMRFGKTTAEWGLLRTLDERGEQTVAALARSRPVARQWIQRLADQLAGEGMLEFIDNPNHKRAKLMRITREGRRLLLKIAAEFEPRADRIEGEFEQRELTRALKTLRAIRERLATELRSQKS